MKVDHLIIGGGIAGVSAAEEIRARDASCSILVLGDEAHLTYSRVMLPHVIRGKTTEPRVFLRTADGLEAKRIAFETGVTVQEVDAEGRTATTSDGRRISFGKLLIATGGRARGLDCPGGDDAAVLRFQTLDDARRIIQAGGAKRAVVIGGGFIALELLMSFRAFGIETVSVTRRPGFFGVLGEEAQELVERHLVEAGVIRRKGETVKELVRDEIGLFVRLGSGVEERADVVGTGLGLARPMEFLPEGGPLHRGAGVVTNEFLETSIPGIFAAGDAAEYFDTRAGRHRVPGNWQAAMFQGKIAGANMANPGEHVRFDMLTSYTISCFGLSLVFLGATDAADEKIVRRAGETVIEWYLEKGHVVGASIVGASSERAAIQKIVSAGVEGSGIMRRQLEAGALDGLV